MRVDGVSVVITTFNGEAWIGPALRSVLDQAVDRPLEVIVVDDRSTDGTVRAVESCGDPRVCVVRNLENLGTARSRNLGVRRARYGWMAFNDQDDVWLPDKLARQVAILESHPDVDGVAGGYARLARDGRSRWAGQLLHKRWSPSHSPRLTAPPYYRPAQHGTCYVQSLLVSKPVLEQLGGFRENLPIAYDPDLFLRLGEVANLAAVEEPVFLYRLSSVSITGSPDLSAAAFLGGFAYMYAAQAARANGSDEPDLALFLRQYRPSPEEVRQFMNNQWLRNINTTWVNEGLGPALFGAMMQVIRRPSLIMSLGARLRAWAR